MNNLSGKRAARLLRVSTTGQDTENQDAPTAAYIGERGMSLAGTYRLTGKSASKGQQVKAVREAIAAARRGEFDVLVIRAIDRLDRRGSLAGWRLLGELLDAGVTVLSAESSEAFLEHVADGTMPMVGTLVSAKLDLAYEEVQAKKRRIHDAFRRMDAEGAFRGNPPAGYTAAGPEYGKYLVPAGRRDAGRTRKGVKVTVTLPGAEDIAGAFADAPVMSTVVLGKRLGMTPDAVCKLLRNRFYSTGVYPVKRSDGVTAVHRVPVPLVTPAVQKRAVEALERRRTGDSTAARGLAQDDYSGALWCDQCQEGTMYRYTGNGRAKDDGTKTPVRRYLCSKCHKSVKGDDADAAVNAMMTGRTAPYLTAEWIEGTDYQAELDRVVIELGELAGRGLDDDAEDAERARLRAERKRLAPLAEQTQPGHWEGRITGLTEGQHWETLTTAERRAWLVCGQFRAYARPRPGRTGAVLVEYVSLDHEYEGPASIAA